MNLILWPGLMGVQINCCLKSFLCLGCEAVVLPAHIHSHMSKIHKSANTSIDMKVINNPNTNEGLSMNWPPIPVEPPLHFPGLETILGFLCPVCDWAYGTFYSHSQHSLMQHNIHPSKGQVVQQAPMLDIPASLAPIDVDHHHLSVWHSTTQWPLRLYLRTQHT